MRADRPSSTAALIAAATVFLAEGFRTKTLVPVGAAEWCSRCLASISARDLEKVRWISRPSLRWIGILAERATVPGLLLHFMARKRWIEAEVRAGLARGGTQVVVIGAGFDTLAVRLASEFPSCRFFEIDHPATQRVKREAVERAGGFANMEFIAADLSREPIDAVLAAMPRYDSRAATAIVIEGLFMYLTTAQVDGVFRRLRDIHAGTMRVVFTVMEPTRDGRFAFHNATVLARWLLSRWSEPFRSAMRRDDAPRFLDAFGLRLAGLADDRALRERYLVPAGLQDETLAVGEILIVGESMGT